ATPAPTPCTTQPRGRCSTSAASRSTAPCRPTTVSSEERIRMASPLKFHWFLPTNGGDGRQVVGGGHGVAAGASGRGATVAYLGQVARSAEQLGFEAALTPTGAWCEDAWVTTAMLSAVTERLKFLVAFRPG